MGEITTIGVDLAKHVFQVHAVDADEATVLRKQLRRGQLLAFFSKLPPCVVGLEACATAHYWARELGALGHEVRLMPAFHRDIDPVRMMRTRFADPIRASSLFGLPQQAGHMTASDLCVARHMISCQAGAIHT
jgi:hypothetical protein